MSYHDYEDDFCVSSGSEKKSGGGRRQRKSAHSHTKAQRRAGGSILKRVRQISECDDMDDMLLFPITDIDSSGIGDNNNSHDADHESDSEEESYSARAKSYVSLRQRRHSRLYGVPLQQLNVNLNIPALQEKVPQKQTPASPFSPELTSPLPRSSGSGSSFKWKLALMKLRAMKDPWEKYKIDELPQETAVRHRYNALKKEWVEDKVLVKMEEKSFNRGAMRSCFRLKKCGSRSACKDWKKALNYVAKKYMEDVDRSVYFEDVKLQNDAKLWGEEYNRHNPPKKVDIFQMSVLEFLERPDKPLYHLEHFIEGEYIKYNSNSGFVDESLRLTPQAFSHFTFERSDHKMIIVDIQGVGDLWTDPQIHTEDGTEYGDGNLGTRGMALFFHSHVCNNICASLHLSKFDLASSEVKDHEKFVQTMKNAETVVRGQEAMVVSCTPEDRVDLTAFLSRRRNSFSSDGRSPSGSVSEVASPPAYRQHSNEEDMDLSTPPSSPSNGVGWPIQGRRRTRFVSESDTSIGSDEEELIRFRMAHSKQRPSNVLGEIGHRTLNNMRTVGHSALGQIHHDLAKYHELGRFTIEGGDNDMNAALFHEEYSAKLGIMEAILSMAKYYLDMQRDVLHTITAEQNDENLNKGVDWMERAAEGGDRSAMVYMAKAYETGAGLGTDREQNHGNAVYWYEEAVHQQDEDASGSFDATMDDPNYLLQAKMAELLLVGEHNLEKDPERAAELYNEAAEGAMGAMKGRLANRYYAAAEEAWGQVEE